MVRKILSLYIMSFMMCPTFAFAEEPETEEVEDYAIVSLESGDPAPFPGVLLSFAAAAKIMSERKFEDVECDLRISYELQIQEEKYQLLLDYKDIELDAWKDKYESMMILKASENDLLQGLIIKQNPGKEPFMVALGFGIGTLTSLGIFALSTEIVKQ